ncbi:class I SAM-dependent methyltransferase [Marinobacter sediminicola]|uniref:class I SAM-dependent methyltransferase n=1 Tax=Marinobacter sediminicola TaxID=3072994 RepID=UPI002811C1C2|nr:class I SAM-dependent methyltransferase [Marinobacter sp. F26243]
MHLQKSTGISEKKPDASAGAICSVCGQGELMRFQTLGDKEYLRCPRCSATIMARKSWLGPDEERAVYELHDNDPGDTGYRSFLEKLALPMLERIQPGASGLDFGCGPGPALAEMMREAGMEVALFDPIFHPAESALSRQYDFITCTEVVEHLHHPAKVFRQLDGLLKPGGWLGVMTCFQTCDDRFDKWHYRRDPTHVVFYREATLKVVAQRMGWTMTVPCKDVAMFYKSL